MLPAPNTDLGLYWREMLERFYVAPGVAGEFEHTLQRLLKDSEYGATPPDLDAQVPVRQRRAPRGVRC